MSHSVDCNPERPISRAYAFHEPHRLDSIQQPPSPYMERANQISRGSNTSTTSSVPTSPSPLIESASKSTLLGPRDRLDDLHDLNHELQHTNTGVHHLTDTGRKVSDQRSKKISQTKPPSIKQERVTVPISLTVFMMTVYILIGATVFTFWESEDYVKWAYFCFITLSTIGFGDIVPGE
ncbi:hypothetical protein P879_00440 [Paragonimus westermani]|uniref:Potassium channel domain-containing protein n=1 Tax=Paragonimus westermani TaxID=34504 RepID=A0A8T0DYZ3_9TREM|nr:hypothetical protein P879_00440 [Paragonimus westermani]